MQRVLEPEVMDIPDQALAYAQADFSDSNAAYVRELVARYGGDLSNAVDLGCGPADVAIRIARETAQAHITAVDGSQAMLDLAREAVEKAGVARNVRLLQALLPGLPIAPQSCTAILCKDMLHHLHDPQVLWREIGRIARPGAAVYVMDLIRPDSTQLATAIVERVAGREHPILKEDFFNSLCAAFTLSEIREQLHSAGLTLGVEQVSDRHMRISGRLPVGPNLT